MNADSTSPAISVDTNALGLALYRAHRQDGVTDAVPLPWEAAARRAIDEVQFGPGLNTAHALVAVLPGMSDAPLITIAGSEQAAIVKAIQTLRRDELDFAEGIKAFMNGKPFSNEAMAWFSAHGVPREHCVTKIIDLCPFLTIEPRDTAQLAAVLQRLAQADPLEDSKDAHACWLEEVEKAFAEFNTAHPLRLKPHMAPGGGHTLHVFAASDSDSGYGVELAWTRRELFEKIIKQFADGDQDEIAEGLAAFEESPEKLDEWIAGHADYFFHWIETRVDFSRMRSVAVSTPMPPLPQVPARQANGIKTGR